MLRDIRAEQDGGNQQEPLQPAVALLLWGSEGRACQQGRAATAVHSEGPASPAWHTRLFVLSRDCTAAQVPGQPEQWQRLRGPSLSVALDDGLKSLLLNHVCAGSAQLSTCPGVGTLGEPWGRAQPCGAL